MQKKSLVNKFPFFYGYIIIFAGTVGVLFSAPGQTIGISVFTDYLIRDLGISRNQLSFTYLIGTLASSIFLTYAGKFYDKYGAKITSVLAGLFLGISLLFLANLPQLVSIFSKTNIDITFTTLILLVIGFFFVRFFGQGTLTMSSKNMVMKWFEKKRGFASAIMGIAISFGFSYSPKIFDDLINNYGWQGAWLFIALLVGVFFTVFALLTFRDDPVQFGLIPDGKEIEISKINKTKFRPIKDFNLSEARKTYNFWIFNLTLALQGLYVTALTFNIVDIFTKAGLSRDDAILIFLPVSIIAVVFQIGGGYLADFIRLKHLLRLQLFGMLLSMVGLSFLSEGLPLYLIILGNGIAGGLFGVLSTVSWPRFYGTKYLGEISGFNMSWIVAGSAIGPYLFTFLFDINQTYFYSGIVMLIICSTLFFLSFKIKNKNIIEN
ncbi:MAG: MFS transporter [Ignavibacteriales bacterium]|nr:MFS transporter [Ignavibacteriales bacterium]